MGRSLKAPIEDMQSVKGIYTFIILNSISFCSLHVNINVRRFNMLDIDVGATILNQKLFFFCLNDNIWF